MGESITINSLLVLMKAIRERVNELRALRSQVSVLETYYGQKEKTVVPQYDVKLVDKKVVELENFLFKADSKIKQANAINTIDIDANVDSLLAPLE
uniref:Uncharacterized protein n=1 Tax=viral metagenome TaxID=1070528 RepID=A0A6M3K525_9ZZZZ